MPDFDRNHSHSLDQGATSTPCLDLTHCPAICNCPVGECTAEVIEENDTLGPCGCVDYHMADCDLMTGGSMYDDGFRDEDDDYYDYP